MNSVARHTDYPLVRVLHLNLLQENIDRRSERETFYAFYLYSLVALHDLAGMDSYRFVTNASSNGTYE